MPNLIVSCTFNPPSIRLIGTTLREETVHKLETKIPQMTTTSTSISGSVETGTLFQYFTEPPHWHVNLATHYCDELGKSMMYHSIIECLEEEEWKLRASNSMTQHDTGKDTTKMFFSRD